MKPSAIGFFLRLRHLRPRLDFNRNARRGAVKDNGTIILDLLSVVFEFPRFVVHLVTLFCTQGVWSSRDSTMSHFVYLEVFILCILVPKDGFCLVVHRSIKFELVLGLGALLCSIYHGLPLLLAYVNRNCTKNIHMHFVSRPNWEWPNTSGSLSSFFFRLLF